MSDLYYCRVAIPETDGSEKQDAAALALATDHAIGQVRYIVKAAGVNLDGGHVRVRVTESMDSELECRTVIAEWWTV